MTEHDLKGWFLMSSVAYAIWVTGVGGFAGLGLAAYGLWLGLTAGQWLATGLFGLFAYVALTVTRAVACSVEMRG